VRTASRRRHHRPIARWIMSVALCDNGAEIRLDDISAALDADRSAGFADPTEVEVDLMVQGDASGEPPPDLCARHPALDMLLTAEMT